MVISAIHLCHWNWSCHFFQVKGWKITKEQCGLKKKKSLKMQQREDCLFSLVTITQLPPARQSPQIVIVIPCLRCDVLIQTYILFFSPYVAKFHSSPSLWPGDFQWYLRCLGTKNLSIFNFVQPRLKRNHMATVRRCHSLPLQTQKTLLGVIKASAESCFPCQNFLMEA